jgi:hypothetical protein
MEKEISFTQLQLPPDEEEDEVEEKSTWGFLVHQISDFYVDNIPVELVKQLPRYCKLVSLLLLLCLTSPLHTSAVQ